MFSLLLTTHNQSFTPEFYFFPNKRMPCSSPRSTGQHFTFAFSDQSNTKNRACFINAKKNRSKIKKPPSTYGERPSQKPILKYVKSIPSIYRQGSICRF